MSSTRLVFSIRMLLGHPGLFVFLLSILLFSTDIVLMGSGKWADFVELPVRKILFITICSYSSWSWLKGGRATIRELQAICALSIFLIIWGLMLPLLMGTTLAFALGDSLPLYGILFLPAIFSVVSKKCLWGRCRLFIYWLTRVLAIFHVTLAILGLFFVEFAELVSLFVHYVLDPVEGKLVGINFEADKFRIMYGSSIFLVIGLYLCLDRLSSSVRSVTLVELVLFILGILATTTRGFYGATVLLFVTYTLLRKIHFRFKLDFRFFLALGVLLISLTVPVLLMIDPSIVGQFQLISRPASDEVRSLQSGILLGALADSLMIGNGFGAHVGQSLEDAAPYSYELSILALYMKIGIIGLAQLLITFALYARTARLNYLNRLGQNRFALWLAGVFSIIFLGNTNPYLFSFLGFFLISFFYFELRSLRLNEFELWPR